MEGVKIQPTGDGLKLRKVTGTPAQVFDFWCKFQRLQWPEWNDKKHHGGASVKSFHRQVEAVCFNDGELTFDVSNKLSFNNFETVISDLGLTVSPA